MITQSEYLVGYLDLESDLARAKELIIKRINTWHSVLEHLIDKNFKQDNEMNWNVANRIRAEFHNWLYQTDCAHYYTIVKFSDSNKNLRYQKQCVLCADTTSQISKSSIDFIPPDRIDKDFINDIRLSTSKDAYAYLNERVQRFLLFAKEKDTHAFFDRYSKYLSSPEWRQKRALVLERDKYLCQARLEDCTITANEVHHLTYDHVFDEPLFDLISVCHDCHIKITERDRENRDNGRNH